jgi:hypothetical protein
MSQETVKTAPAAAPDNGTKTVWPGTKNLKPPWPPGVSGNPSGRSKRYQQLFDVIAAEVGGDSGLTAMQREYISRAAENMRRAEHAKDNNERVRLTRCAMGLVDRVRDMRRERERDAPSASTLDQYLAQRATEGADA